MRWRWTACGTTMCLRLYMSVGAEDNNNDFSVSRHQPEQIRQVKLSPLTMVKIHTE